MTNVPTGPAGEAMSDPRSVLSGYHAAMSARIAVDPMLAMIRALESERERFNASDDPDDERAGGQYFWLFDQLKRRTPPIYTDEGAIAALQLAAREMEHSTGGLEEPLVAAALAFIRTGRA
ncbi:hypothetical protein [Aureimonas psammosilenae]|uniref:hypothetical protein n=1 Tax=Aureimonas psammosilenae TaxID=2495496 RepID=UPI001260FA6D|nr:hypothetical protein [Aureimonas psammosilenae]